MKNGEWTLDKLAELTKGIYEDADGDGAASFGDGYGFLLGYDTVIDTFKEALEVPMSPKRTRTVSRRSCSTATVLLRPLKSLTATSIPETRSFSRRTAVMRCA